MNRTFNGGDLRVVSLPQIKVCITLVALHSAKLETMFRASITSGLLLVLLSMSMSIHSQTIHITHCLKGCPLGTPNTNDLVSREIYAVSSNDETKLADWVAYKVTRDSIGVGSLLSRERSRDPMLEDTLEPEDFTEEFGKLGLYRGHYAPLPSFAGTVYWREINLMSNVAPQKTELRFGPWFRLEQSVRTLASSIGEVYVTTGPVYGMATAQGLSRSISEGGKTINVPSAFFKVVATEEGRISTFIFSQQLRQNSNHCDQRVTLHDIEAATGLRLFPRSQSWPVGSLDQQLGCEQ